MAHCVAMSEAVQTPLAATLLALDALRPHPRNYRAHPEDQLRHIEASINEHGFYRNVVACKDGTILAGHGVVEASRRLGLKQIPVVRLDIDPDDVIALKILAGDNTIQNLADDDDRKLSELLKELLDSDSVNLLGTGFDEQMLASLIMVTRPANEIEDFDAAKEWVGMPGFDPGKEEKDGETVFKLVIKFETIEARVEFIRDSGIKGVVDFESGARLGSDGVQLSGTAGERRRREVATMHAWHPPREVADAKSLEWTDEAATE